MNKYDDPGFRLEGKNVEVVSICFGKGLKDHIAELGATKTLCHKKITDEAEISDKSISLHSWDTCFECSAKFRGAWRY
jgi:5,10-methylene-tetrahydrofolate dehydrogenase/methenyl tetrahydrofolate cyclohydrolase